MFIKSADETETKIRRNETPNWNKWIWPSGISGIEALDKASSEAEHY
nr:6854_t:CDS:2 [Entrophospora candida]